ncbi:MAG TPA: NADPH-dependent F420 reductase [Acidimicrobiales bacterium]|nr:NADPH-dependent F420 reductase [Acidimicrobiales bacterium]
MNVGIIGGTGPAGRALALRLASVGHNVVIGSRDRARSSTAANELRRSLDERSNFLHSGSNNEAALSEIVVLATPWEGAVATATDLSEPLREKVLVSMVSALARVGDEFQAVISSRGSIAASLQSVLPETFVTTGFQHVPARDLAGINKPLDAHVMICSDSERGFLETKALVTSIEGLHAVFCGSLASANAVEALTAVLLNINVRYKAHVSMRLTGFDENG